MAKFIISESQYNMLREMQIPSGKYETNPLGDFLGFLDSKLSTKKISKMTRKYLESHVGLDTSMISDENLYEYFSKLKWDWEDKITGIPKYFYRPGIISGLSYYFAKNLFKLKKTAYGLVYYLDELGTYRNYWFFDPEIKDFIGRIQIQVNDNFPSPSYQVALSSVDKAFIGRGYGNKMYLTILNDCEYLL